MRQPKGSVDREYLNCPRYKGRHKKHVAVCARCGRNGSCPAYRRYRQPELPFGTPRPSTPPPDRFSEE